MASALSPMPKQTIPQNISRKILGIVVEDDRLPVLAGPYHDNMCLGMFGAGAGRAGPSPDICVLRIRCHHFAADSAFFLLSTWRSGTSNFRNLHDQQTIFIKGPGAVHGVIIHSKVIMIEGVAGSKEFFLWITPADPADVTGKTPVVCGVQLGYYGYTEHSRVRITRRAPGIWLCLPYLARPRDGLYSHSRRTEGYEMPTLIPIVSDFRNVD